MPIRRHHVFLSATSLAVIVLLGFAGAFLDDAFNTNRAHEVLAAHHVAVRGRLDGCASVIGGRSRATVARLCQYRYTYGDAAFTALIPLGQSSVFLVDPKNTSIRMREVNFAGSDGEMGVDIALAAALLVGATTVMTVHLSYLRRRRRRREHHAVADPVSPTNRAAR